MDTKGLQRQNRSETTVPVESLPLRGVRIVDLTDGNEAMCGRYLADLGADVLLVEPPEGVASRTAPPLHAGVGLRFATQHWNKRGITLDLSTEGGRASLLDLTDRADLVIESYAPGLLSELGLGQDVMRHRNPSLVVVSITDFGQTGPRREWQGGESVHVAMSSVLTRSGAPDRAPLLPPGDFATETAAIQAAFAALAAYYGASSSGVGDYVDCSLLDLSVQCLDPGFGMAGTARMGPLLDIPPGRPDARMMYPIIACRDGHVRLCMLAPKHWRGMFRWLGEPAEFADPSWERLVTRFASWPQLRGAIEALFASKTRAEILSEGDEFAVPVAALNSPADILSSDHVAARHSFVDVEVARGLVGRVPNGCVELHGVHAGFRCRAPELNEHAVDVRAELRSRPPKSAGEAHPTPSGTARPLDGVRVLDLGVVVVGAETGRLLADQGAQVIKVENPAFIDGARQMDTADTVGYSFAVGNRGKLSLGLDLRSERGGAIFRDLVAKSDVVLTNFKPGTMESLGFEYQELRDVNPGIIVVDSSALGNTGPWSNRMGYGPLVRATVGLTGLWRHPDSDDAFGDAMTVYPDHAAARVAATAVIAALLDRRRSGAGRQISLAQMETAFTQLAVPYLREFLEPGTMVARGGVNEFEAPSGVFACSGDDAYCTISVRGDLDWQRLAATMGRVDLAADPKYRTSAGRVAHRGILDEALSRWIAALTPGEAQDRLQAAGIAAAAAAHVRDLLVDPQLAARAQFVTLPQPGLDAPVHVETGPALFENLPVPEVRAAPLMGEQSRRICRDVLGLSNIEIDTLIADSVLTESTRRDVPSSSR